VAIAKLAERNLDPIWLRDFASRLLFGAPVPSDFPAAPSTCAVPDEPVAFAQTAAGFGDVRLSAFHGAALAAAIANGGVLVPLHTFEVSPEAKPTAADDSADGDDRDEAASPGPVQLLPKEIAQSLAGMMRLAVTEGTARKAFRFRGAKALEACGKTGSLADKKPFRDYSWFVGFAPESDPKIAVAALVVNGQKWKVHASSLAAAAIRTYLKEISTPGRQLTAEK
jgi:cell division protein FtsI/penicillin-binding protein 2